MRYSSKEFSAIKNSAVKFELPEELKYDITELTNIIRSGISVYPDKSTSTNRKKPVYRNTKITSLKDWDTLRNFSATKVKQASDATTKLLEKIRSLFNKISDKTYDNIIPQIRETMAMITDEHNDKVMTLLFNTVGTNSAYSMLYVSLFTDLFSDKTGIDLILKNYIDNFERSINDIAFVNPNVDYDNYCKNNKANDSRRSIGLFIVNLANQKLISMQYIVNIICTIQKLFASKMNEENNKEIIDELSEIIYVLITNSKHELSAYDNKAYEEIKEEILKVSKLKARDYVSLSSKAVFRHMDMLDNLKL